MHLVPLENVFNVVYGVNLEESKLKKIDYHSSESIPFVSRKSSNNGVSSFVLKREGLIPNPKNTISVAGGGSVLSCFFHPYEYYSGRDLFYLEPINKEMNNLEMIIYTKYINKNMFRFNYGRQANTSLRSLLIPERIPQSVYGESSTYYKNLKSKITLKPNAKKSIDLNLKKWKYFKLNTLFSIEGSKTTSKRKLKKDGNGKYPYITTSTDNNATESFYKISTEIGGVLVIDSAVVGHCTYQPIDFSASDHVEKLIPNFKMSKQIALFLCTILNLEKFRYNYGLKASQKRLNNVSIKLPSDNGKPDFDFMENYVNSCKFSMALKHV